MKLQPVILCGGSGTRMWPLSREQYPKQLLTLHGCNSLLQATALRLAPLGEKAGTPLVVSNEEYRFITAEQLRQVGIPSRIVLEPTGRNTAPALTIAALTALQGNMDPVMLVMPADHVIINNDAFCKAIERGIPHAESGKIITFGITPSRPETGYGYIRASSTIPGDVFEIDTFAEKPDLKTAQEYLTSGDYYWNAGIFMVKASAWLAAIERTRPDITAACRTGFAESTVDNDFVRIGKAAFEACPADSIDYAVMEKLPRGAGLVVPLDAGWSDVGAWDALWDLGAKDADNNLLQGDVIAVSSRNTLAISQSRLVTLVGLDNTVVVETPDAVLVAHKDRIQDIKKVVAKLKEKSRSEANAHRKIYRPWGYYDSIDSGSRFQVKRIVVNPGAALSLQLHHHRAEHWIVVRGTARVTRGDDVFLVSENESTYIPLGTRHRLENPGKVPLEMIEVQSGAYLGEDDIVRFEDTYGRN